MMMIMRMMMMTTTMMMITKAESRHQPFGLGVKVVVLVITAVLVDRSG